MSSYNKVVFLGNLTRDPELKFTQSGTAVGNFDIAVNSSHGSGDDKKEEVMFIGVTVWGKQAENCSQYLKKGSQVLVDGRLKLETWQKDEKTCSKHVVIANLVQFLNKKLEEA